MLFRSGNDIKTADFNADISSFEYNGYRYNNISAIGNYNNGSIDATLKVDDVNANIIAKGNLIKTSEGLKTVAEMTINNLNPSALRLTDSQKGRTFKMNISADGMVSNKNPNLFNGILSLKDVVMTSEDRSYILENINISSSNESIAIDGDFGNALLKGNNAIDNLAACMRKVVGTRQIGRAHV